MYNAYLKHCTLIGYITIFTTIVKHCNVGNKDRTTFGIARTDPTFWPLFARNYLPTLLAFQILISRKNYQKLYSFLMFTTLPTDIF